MKKHKFAEGGGTSVDEDPIGGVADFESQNSPDSKADVERIDFGKPAGKGAEPPAGKGSFSPVAASPKSSKAAEKGTEPPAKTKVITKEELAKSGLSLRDYMNKQQGLKRRGVNPTLGEARNSAEQSAADAIDPGDIRTRELGRTRGSPSYDSAGKPSNAGPDVLSSNYSRNTRTGATAKMASGGSVKGWGQARGARSAKIF